MTKVNINGVSRDMTAEEQAAYDAQEKAYADASEARKLEEIKRIRLEKLQVTDWMANSDVTMSDEWKAYRQALRDITKTYKNPQEVVWPTPPS